MQSHPDFGLAEPRVLARREAHVAGKDELAADATAAASDLCEADHRALAETDEGVRQDRETGRPDSSSDVPSPTGQIEVRKVKVGIRAFEGNELKLRIGLDLAQGRTTSLSA